MEGIILIIGDETTEAVKLKSNLESLGFDVRTLESIQDGIKSIKSNAIDLVVLLKVNSDIMAVKTGSTKDIPIVALLEQEYKANVNSISVYIDDYIFKPYDFEQLYLKIKVNLKVKKLQDMIKRKDEELKEIYKRLDDTGLLDKSMGVFNSSYLHSIIEKECAESFRYGRELSGIMFDIDNREAIEKKEDTFKEFVHVVKKNIRKNDIFATLESGEFYLLLPNTGLKEAAFVANKLRTRINSQDFGLDKKITISGGVATFDEIERGVKKEEEIISKAKEALMRAKEKGGNIIECY